MTMFRKLSSLARTPQGRRAINNALNYARSPRGQRQLREVRERLAGTGSRRRRNRA